MNNSSAIGRFVAVGGVVLIIAATAPRNNSRSAPDLATEHTQREDIDRQSLNPPFAMWNNITGSAVTDAMGDEISHGRDRVEAKCQSPFPVCVFMTTTNQAHLPTIK